jgi:hypothetical protein
MERKIKAKMKQRRKLRCGKKEYMGREMTEKGKIKKEKEIRLIYKRNAEKLLNMK